MLNEGMNETRIALALAQDTFPFRSRARRARDLGGDRDALSGVRGQVQVLDRKLA
ncbi:hypothetical protein ACMHYB_20935 [Sorangium sp. So ce1128]